jgi:hypothetical protein
MESLHDQFLVSFIQLIADDLSALFARHGLGWRVGDVSLDVGMSKGYDIRVDIPAQHSVIQPSLLASERRRRAPGPEEGVLPEVLDALMQRTDRQNESYCIFVNVDLGLVYTKPLVWCAIKRRGSPACNVCKRLTVDLELPNSSGMMANKIHTMLQYYIITRLPHRGDR